MRLPPEKRAALLADLRLREKLTDQALMEKYGVSRATLWRVLDEDREKQYASEYLRKEAIRFRHHS